MALVSLRGIWVRLEATGISMATTTQDTEITLGTGKLLGIFFALVILCSVFFTLGYMLGHSASSGATTQIVGTVPSSGNPANKPSAANKGTDVALQTPVTAVPNVASGKAPENQSDSSTPTADKSSEQADAVKNTPPQLRNQSGSYMVQVDAVSKQEDAEIRVTALRKKQYPVLIVSNIPGDSLFHVQVGPFTDAKEAESMRSRLAGDGYNAIVKK